MAIREAEETHSFGAEYDGYGSLRLPAVSFPANSLWKLPGSEQRRRSGRVLGRAFSIVISSSGTSDIVGSDINTA
ncbi:MAG TPA: hypothetical protein VF444_24225 [Pseudonocardiaceae bacterium]